MTSPDYENYDLDELYDVLQNIDREKWPERVAQVQAILNDPIKVKKLKAKRAKLEEKYAKEDEKTKLWGFGWIYSFIGIFLLVTGTLVFKGKGIQIESWPIRILLFLYLLQ